MVDKRNLSILFVCRGPFGFLGGAASFMFPKVLTEMGHKVHVVSFGDSYGTTEKVYNTQKNAIVFEEYWTPFTFKKIKILKDSIIKHRPDIIHVFRIQKFFLFPIYCKLSGLTVPKWLIDVRSPPVNLNYPRTTLTAKIKRKLNVFYQTGFDGISSPVLSSAKENFSTIFKPFYEVPFGVDFSGTDKKKWGQPPKNAVIRFVYVGSIAKQRKIEVLIQAIALCKKYQHRKFRVDIFGAGDFVDSLVSMIKTMNLEDTIHYKGVVPQPELFKRLIEYDVGIGYVPYEQYMGSPALKVLEYMAVNLLVIASDTTGIKKQVTHNVNGILFQNTPESIAKTMLNILGNGCPLNVIEAGYDYSRKNSWEWVVKNYLLKAYYKLLNN